LKIEIFLFKNIFFLYNKKCICINLQIRGINKYGANVFIKQIRLNNMKIY